MEAFERSFDVFDLLRTLRSRRVGYGYRVDSGTTETHPVTGRTLEQPKGPRSFVSAREPLPLTEVEEALLCWAACGPNGIVAWEASIGAGFEQLTETLGRTCPEPNNTHATDLVVINDDGAFLYRPTPSQQLHQPLLPDEPEDFLEAVVDLYRSGRTQLTDARPDIDWAMRESGAPNAMLNGSHQYNLNRPGSSWFLPVTDTGRLQRGLVDLFYRQRHFIFDDLHDADIAVFSEVREGHLVERAIAMSDYERSVLLNSAYPAAIAVQNVRLAAEALGLGVWALSGYDQAILLGLRPDLAHGIGFQADGFRALKQATCLPSRWFSSGADVVAAWREQRERWHGESGMLTGHSSPFCAGIGDALDSHEDVDPPKWAWEAAASYIDYCVETHGRWPVTYDPLLAGFSAIVHHADTEFYERFHRSGYLTERIYRHEVDWHAG